MEIKHQILTGLGIALAIAIAVFAAHDFKLPPYKGNDLLVEATK